MNYDFSVSNKTKLNHQFNNLQKYFIYILFFYTFCYTNAFTVMASNIVHVNLLYPFFPVVIIIAYCLFFNRRVNYFVLFLVFWIFLFNIISLLYFKIGFSSVYRYSYGILVPLLLIGIRLEQIKEVIRKFLRLFNWLIILNVIYGLADYLSGKKLQFILADLLYSSHYYSSIQSDMANGVYRLFSLLGHPLTNMLLLIIFVSVNILYFHYYKETAHIPIYLVYLTVIFGTFLVNSKFGIILLTIILMSTILTGKKKARNLFYIFVCSIAVLSSQSLRENVISRFLQASESGDLSNGRFSAIESLMNSQVNFPYIFLGKGIGASDTLLRSISDLNNIEIPIIMYSFDYGIFPTLLLYIILYFIPACLFIKNKHYYLLFLFTIITIFANSYNGIATSAGIVQIITFITMLLMNLSNSLKTEVKNKI